MDAQPIAGQWMVVELLGHNILYGIVTEEQHFGVTLGRVEVPTGEDTWLTRWFGGGAVFRLTPTDEETARRLAGYRRPQISQFSSAGRPEFGQPERYGVVLDDDSSHDGYDIGERESGVLEPTEAPVDLPF